MKTIRMDGIGEVRVVRSRRGKYLRLQIDRNSEIRLTVPYLVSIDEAEKWLHKKQAWLKKKLAEKNRQEETRTRFMPGVRYFTRFHLFYIEPWEKETCRLEIKREIAVLHYPAYMLPEGETLQLTAGKAMVKVLRREAHDYLPGRLEDLAGKNGFRYKSLGIRENRSRWGSCSTRGHISLNLHLLRLPDHLIDYVLIHELVHTEFPNHGKGFWSRLDEITGGAKRLDRELKACSPSVF